MVRHLFLGSLVAAIVACSGSKPANGDGEGDGQPQPPEGIPTYGYRIVNVYPHDPEAWTQGLVFAGGFLYEGTGGGDRLTSHPSLPPSGLRKVEIETGRVLESIYLDERFFGEGIALLGERVYQLTWTSKVGFVYALDGFARLDDFSYPTEGWGLTHDGTALIMSDGTSTLYRRDPATFAELGRVVVRYDGTALGRLNELEWVDGEVWANIWSDEIVARIDPGTGAVVGWIDLRGLLTSRERQGVDVLNGIAYDATTKRIFVTGKLWPWLFQIELVPR